MGNPNHLRIIPPIILGYTWLTLHDHLIFWTKGYIIQWGDTCQELCCTATDGTCSEKSQPNDVDLTAVLSKYHNLAMVFSKDQAIQLPPHRTCDLAI